MPFFVYVLGLAVFAQGTSEFMLSGLVPGIAGDLSVSVGAAASLTSAYAAGMVLGAPLMAVAAAHWPRRVALAGFLAAFVAVHVVGALTADFAVLFTTRVVAAVVNAGFLAVAMSVATSLAPPARAAATLVSGVTLSCVVGVPAGALLGEWAGWRSAFWAVAALCLPALALVFRDAPATPAHAPAVSVGREARVLRGRRVRSALLLASLVNGATFATFAYLAVLATEVAHLPTTAVPALLAGFGAGAFAGVTAAGRLADGRLRPGLVPVLCALPAGWAALALTAAAPVPLIVLSVVQGGLSFGVGSTLVARVLHVADRAPTLGGAFATAALNVGAFAGPLLAAAVTGATHDYRDAAWTSAALAAAAVVVLAVTAGEEVREAP